MPPAEEISLILQYLKSVPICLGFNLEEDQSITSLSHYTVDLELNGKVDIIYHNNNLVKKKARNNDLKSEKRQAKEIQNTNASE